MKKFPVISENGRKYHVQIMVGNLIAQVKLYEEDGFTEVYSVCESTLCIMGAKPGDYVSLTKTAIAIYEKYIIKTTTTAENQIRKFEQWDGNCSIK